MDHIELLPGFLQGITRVIISYPFDYLRIFKQTDVKFNYFDEVKKANIFKGIAFPLFSVPIDRAITFSMFERLKQKGMTTLECSLYPSILSSAYMTPVNLLNTNYIYFRTKPIKDILRENVNSRIFRGLNIEVFRNVLSSTIYLSTYKHLSDIQNKPFINGALSSFVLWSLLYPLDTVKVHKFIYNKPYTQLFRDLSIPSLYKGIGLLYLRTIPSSGLGMIVYERTKAYVNNLQYK